MSLKQKLISTVTLAVAVGAFGSYASAQETPSTDAPVQRQEKFERRGGFGGRGMRGGKHGGGDRMMMRSLEELNLTDSQKEQIRTISENYRVQNQPQMEEMRDLGMKKRDGVITEQELTRLKELKNQMRTTGNQLRDSISAVLTPEQRTQLDKIKAERMEKMRERRMNRQNQQNQTVQPPTDN